MVITTSCRGEKYKTVTIGNPKVDEAWISMQVPASWKYQEKLRVIGSDCQECGYTVNSEIISASKDIKSSKSLDSIESNGCSIHIEVAPKGGFRFSPKDEVAAIKEKNPGCKILSVDTDPGKGSVDISAYEMQRCLYFRQIIMVKDDTRFRFFFARSKYISSIKETVDEIKNSIVCYTNNRGSVGIAN
ncbi:hypothetical protein [Hymenobacter volaticus]|uniref:Uncharacterized protein n=1 Tax=Hymenobacter volaticus TaxID=2932254 RepID=A0ABY4G2V1_9BACT|nr:hypothetical protein [Hymenobacter volaticus]UOQ65202.1 hypothetical protein MUN86_16800 [Hymenobacter volaticus]